MSRYIDKAKLAQRLLASPIFKNARNGDLIRDAVIDIVCDYPAAGVVEVKHGEWGFDGAGWSCSECDEYGTNLYKYCPHCGAKMDGGIK